MIADDKIRKEMLSSFFKMDKAEFNKCLEPTMSCTEKAIRAHSVQNSRVLELLCTNGHVTAFKRWIDKDKGPQISLGLVGRNKATTFSGLCSKHDQEIFNVIDNKKFDKTNKEHLFFIAYRSIHRELHATMEAASKIQSVYLKRAAMGIDPHDQPSEAGMTAIGKMYVSWETWKYKTYFDEIYVNQKYDLIAHEPIMVNHARPSVAVSALFSIDEYTIGDDVLRVILNVFPISTEQTLIVFSYRDQEKEIARVALDRVLSSTGMHQLYETSRIILNNCENFVFSPIYVDSWEDPKKETITNYFINTLFKSDMDYHSPYLYLF